MSLIDHRGARAAVRQYRPDVWLTLFWDVPEASDVEAVIGQWERAIEIGQPYRSIVDARLVRRIDPASFGALVAHIQRRGGDYLRLLERQAIVRPEGIAGAITAGLLTVVSWTATLAHFTDGVAAAGWLLPDDRGLAEEYPRWVAGLTTLAPVVRRLREAIAADLADLDIERAARQLGVSPRSLQRQLLAAETSFSDELAGARIERAKELLVSSDEKIGVIARSVGLVAEGRFSQFFADATGETPSEWRARRR